MHVTSTYLKNLSQIHKTTNVCLVAVYVSTYSYMYSHNLRTHTVLKIRVESWSVIQSK